MSQLSNAMDKVKLRPAEQVMRLERLGSFHQCRLSFMRTLLRRMKRETWKFDQSTFDIDKNGVGVAIYTMHAPKHSYSLVCFAHDLPADQRSDRVIAHAWDATFTLFDGVPTPVDIERLSQNVPKQEAGRISHQEICLSRANRSVRLFDYVVDCLAKGQQPDKEQVEAVGYLMRTTAVYGSGKFGAADRETIADRPEFSGPFQAEMLCVFLIRAFALDLVEHMAHIRSPNTAVKVEPKLRRCFGVGNSTGLGLAPFIINHPILLNNWILAREEALARIRSLDSSSAAEKIHFREAVKWAQNNTNDWQTSHPIQVEKLSQLKDDLEQLESHMEEGALDISSSWDRLYQWSEGNLSVEGQEQVVSLMLEPFGALVDDLTDNMSADEGASFPIDGAMRLSQLKDVAEEVYAWTKDIDWSSESRCARVWYVSQEKLEPRLGERFEEPIEPYEQPLAPARDAAQMVEDILNWKGETTVAAFLMRHPEHRHIARRVQIIAKNPYAEIRDNTIDADLLPIDLLRCKLSFFGATHFDPRSDRWLRINMFRNAPFPNEIENDEIEKWAAASVSEQ